MSDTTRHHDTPARRFPSRKSKRRRIPERPFPHQEEQPTGNSQQVHEAANTPDINFASPFKAETEVASAQPPTIEPPVGTMGMSPQDTSLASAVTEPSNREPQSNDLAPAKPQRASHSTVDTVPYTPTAHSQSLDTPVQKHKTEQADKDASEALEQELTTTAALRKQQLHVIARKKRQRKRKIITGLILVMLLVIIVATSVAAIKFLNISSYLAPAEDYTGKEAGSKDIRVEIPAGANGQDIAVILKKKDVVKSEDAFVEAFKKNSAAQGIQDGWYSLRTKMKASEALAALLDEANKIDVAITIVPGKTIDEVKAKFINNGQFTKEEIDAAFENVDALGLPAEANGHLEGWLAPETYRVDPNMTVQDLLKQMISHNTERLEKLKVPRDKWHDVLTKASIVEKEGKEEDFPKIARVIENRLAGKGENTAGLLQMDCTVAYGVGKGGSGAFITQEEKKQDTPYNTYLHKGLPPTPIASVGDSAIEAVMNPPEGDWLYYVTVDLVKGTTKFAATHEEQKKNIEELRQYCKENPEVCKTENE
ncbi:MAG: endolytic transglycosylase MltG [Actinomycetaceae bacterium]|nr:endolytic transglycosylase MltG [Actinomycetaceae bacterium]